MLFSLKGLAVSLTVHTAKNQRPYAIEFYTRCQVEVLFGILVNLTENKRFPFKTGFQINANTWIVSKYFGKYWFSERFYFINLLSVAFSADRGWLIVYYWLRRRVECFLFARVCYLHRDNVCQSTDGNNMQLSVGEVLHFAPQYLCIFAAVQSVPHL